VKAVRPSAVILFGEVCEEQWVVYTVVIQNGILSEKNGDDICIGPVEGLVWLPWATRVNRAGMTLDRSAES